MIGELLIASGVLWLWDKRKRTPPRRAAVSVPSPPPPKPPPPEPQPQRLLPPPRPDADDDQNRAIDRNVRVSMTLLGATTAGALVSPVFTVASVPFLIYQALPRFQRAYAEVTTKHKVGGDVMRAVISAGMLLTGAYWVAALNGLIIAGVDKLCLLVQRSSRRSLNLVFGDLPRTVCVRRGGHELMIAIEDAIVGDLVVIRAGEAIAVDGLVEAGVASIDQQALTGEAQPAEKAPGDRVLAGTIVLSGSIDVQIERTGKDTLVAQIEEILQRTATYTSQTEQKGKVIAEKTVLPVLVASAVTLPVLGPIAASCMLAVYPGEGMRALGPISLLNFLRRGAEDRIMIRDGRALEALKDVNTVVFDKTGTLTESVPTVVRIHVVGDHTEDAMLALAAATEVRQTHPIALAIQREAQARQLALPPVEDSSYEIGLGISVRIDGVRVRVGSARYLARHAIELPAWLRELDDDTALAGHTVVFVAAGDAIVGALELAPTLRPAIKQLVDALHARGLEVFILSGDREGPTRRLAEQLGADAYFFGTLPHQKALLVDDWQAAGRSVCFVGDGINDSIALKKAHVSVSLAGASAIATDTAQILFMDPSLEKMLPLFQLADELAVNMERNLDILLVPSPILLFGIWLFGFRYGVTMFLITVSSVAGLANAGMAARGPRPAHGEPPVPRPRLALPAPDPAATDLDQSC